MESCVFMLCRDMEIFKIIFISSLLSIVNNKKFGK